MSECAREELWQMVNGWLAAAEFMEKGIRNSRSTMPSKLKRKHKLNLLNGQNRLRTNNSALCSECTRPVAPAFQCRARFEFCNAIFARRQTTIPMKEK